MTKAKAELEELLKILMLEKEKDFEQYKSFVQSLSLSDRVDKGYTWYPLQVVRSGYTIGERAFVIVERHAPPEEKAHHRFRSGNVVNLFSNNPESYQPEKRGVINFIQKNRMKIVLNAKDLPDWLKEGAIGVDQMFDERSYLEMEKALKNLLKAKGDRLAELRDIIYDVLPPNEKELLPAVNITSLNPSQNQAVNQVLASKDVAVIHGPPGTGKTTTLVQAIKATTQREAVVLVTAPSNTAVDLLTERIAQEGIEVVRIGNISRVDENLIQHTLDGKMASHPENKNIKKVKKQAAEYRRLARKYKRSFGHKEREQRAALHKEARELGAWANQLEDRLLEQILSNSSVITCTLVGASQKILDRVKFKTVFIDEAAQALEPATWIPISRVSKVVLAGDPFQLPPTVKSNEAMKKGLSITLIEKCLAIDTPRSKGDLKISLLTTQYRMNENIMAFSNQQFYDNQLKADETVKDWKLEIEDQKPISFIDTAGCSFDEKTNPVYQSRYNPDEFNILREHLYALLDQFNLSEEISTEESKLIQKTQPSIGIISPYREQVIYIKKEVEEDARLREMTLSVDTIDGFQGQERDLIYISLVRSNGKGEIGFLKDERRMNVAMTRARKALIVIGDSSTIGQNKFYQAFIQFCEDHDFYKSAWEYMI